MTAAYWHFFAANVMMLAVAASGCHALVPYASNVAADSRSVDGGSSTTDAGAEAPVTPVDAAAHDAAAHDATVHDATVHDAQSTMPQATMPQSTMPQATLPQPTLLRPTPSRRIP